MKHPHSSADYLNKLYTPDIYAVHKKRNATQDDGENQRGPDDGYIYHFIFLPEWNKREIALSSGAIIALAP
jgi:hypothetical protein